MTETQKESSWYNKIVASIKSSTNKLHLTTCAGMIGQYDLAFEQCEQDVVSLRLLLDEKADSLGFDISIN